MVDVLQIYNNVDSIMTNYGTPVSGCWWALGSLAFDDYGQATNPKNTASGTYFTMNAVILPLSKGDYGFVDKGAINQDDMACYIIGSININSTCELVALGGSWRVLPKGIENWVINGSSVYKKMYIRKINNP